MTQAKQMEEVMEKSDFIKEDKVVEEKIPSKEEHNGNTGIKHGFMMILCCALPFLLILVLPLIGFKNISWTGVIFLLCPLMHIGMMFKKK